VYLTNFKGNGDIIKALHIIPRRSPLSDRHTKDSSAEPSRPETRDGFFAALQDANVPPDFLDAAERDQRPQNRDPFEAWYE
jgi:hypothetical protein